MDDGSGVARHDETETTKDTVIKRRLDTVGDLDLNFVQSKHGGFPSSLDGEKKQGISV